jgi:hypothetical protein
MTRWGTDGLLLVALSPRSVRHEMTMSKPIAFRAWGVMSLASRAGARPAQEGPALASSLRRAASSAQGVRVVDRTSPHRCCGSSIVDDEPLTEDVRGCGEPGWRTNTAVAEDDAGLLVPTGNRRAATNAVVRFANPKRSRCPPQAPPSLSGASGTAAALPAPPPRRPVIETPFSTRLHPGCASTTDPSCEVMPSK